MTPRPPLVLVVMPLLTLLSLAFSMLLGEPSDRLVYARAWGGPPAAALAARIQVVAESSGLARGAAGERLTVTLESAGETSVRSVVSGVDGWVEVLLPVGAQSEGGRLHIEAAAPPHAVLGRGAVKWSRAAWQARAAIIAGQLPPTPALPVSVRFEPPVWSVPFAGEVVLELATGAAAMTVRAEAHGAELGSPAEVELTSEHGARLRLVPREHIGTLTLRAVSSEGEAARSSGALAGGTRSLTLPIVPGSPSAWADGDDLIISSPVTRLRVYYSVVTREARLGGGAIDLGPRPDGTAVGRLARGGLPAGTDRYLVLSSSADGQAPSLVGLPLDGQSQAFGPRELPLLDGRAQAVRAAERRHARARWVLASYAGLGALLSLVLFVWHIRRANERLRTRLEEVGAPGARDRSQVVFASAVLSLMFAFGLALTWILVR